MSIVMEQLKCPRCKYPLVKKIRIVVCQNCKLIVHEADIYIPDFFGKAVYIGKI